MYTHAYTYKQTATQTGSQLRAVVQAPMLPTQTHTTAPLLSWRHIKAFRESKLPSQITEDTMDPLSMLTF